MLRRVVCRFVTGDEAENTRKKLNRGKQMQPNNLFPTERDKGIPFERVDSQKPAGNDGNRFYGPRCQFKGSKIQIQKKTKSSRIS